MARMNVDTDLLRTFVTIVDLGGFMKAAGALGRTQSAISMQMKRLEQATQTALFRRSGRIRVLTPAGEILLGYARQLIRLHDQALEELQDDVVTGEVKLAVMDDYATHILPDALAAFISQYPTINVEVTTGFSSDLLPQLGQRFDLVLATQPEGHGVGKVLRTERTRWAFSANHELRYDDAIPLALLTPGNLFRDWALSALDEAGLRWRVLYTSTSIAAVEAAAEAGIAITVVKEGTARAGLKLLKDDFGLPALPASEISLHQSPGKLSNAAQTLSEFLVRTLQS